MHRMGHGRTANVANVQLFRNIEYAVEQLVRSAACRALGIYQSFGDDALSYFTERLDPVRIRAALIDILRRAKRNKVFQNSAFLGLAMDGTSAGRSRDLGCALCRPQCNAKKDVMV